MNRPNSFQSIDRSRADVADGVVVPSMLVAVDLTESTSAVLREARIFAQKFDAMVHVLHVVQCNVATERCGVPRWDLVRDMADSARRELHRLIRSIWNEDILASITIREGSPAKVIVQVAHATDASMIVLGMHDRFGWLRLLRHRTFARVVHHSPCPVLAVRLAAAAAFNAELRRNSASIPP